jgi:hypothetical protein
MIADIVSIAEKWKSQANLFKVPLHVSFIDRLLSVVVRLLQPFL